MQGERSVVNSFVVKYFKHYIFLQKTLSLALELSAAGCKAPGQARLLMHRRPVQFFQFGGWRRCCRHDRWSEACREASDIQCEAHRIE
jgi:hypothetical protein